MILINMKSDNRLSPREVTKGAAPEPCGSTSPSRPVTLEDHVTRYKAPYNRTLLAFLLSHTDTPLHSTPVPPSNMVRNKLFVSLTTEYVSVVTSLERNLYKTHQPFMSTYIFNLTDLLLFASVDKISKIF